MPRRALEGSLHPFGSIYPDTFIRTADFQQCKPLLLPVTACLALAAIVVGLTVACGDSIRTQPHIVGSCIPSTPPGVASGDTWTIRGTVDLELGREPGEERKFQQTDLITTYRVTGFEDNEQTVDGETVIVEHGTVHLEAEHEQLTLQGQWLSSQRAEFSTTTVAVAATTPVLTPDWDCHRDAWLAIQRDSGEEDGATEEYTVEDAVLTLGVEAIVFRRAESRVSENEDGEMSFQVIVHLAGYDRETGRLVIKGRQKYGIVDALASGSRRVQELITAKPTIDRPSTVELFMPPPPEAPQMLPTPTPHSSR